MIQLGNTKIYQLENLELIARQVVEGFIIGLHKSPFHGFSVEFAEHRIYNTGEPIKNIDWKVFGRTDKLFVKKFEEETNLRCHLVIDNSGSMYYPDTTDSKNNLSKIKFATIAAACFQYILKRQRDAVGLSIFAEKVSYQLDARSSATHHKLLSNQLELLFRSEVEQQQTATAKCLHEIAEGIHKRSMVVIFSDMFDNLSKAGVEDLFSALQHLRHNNHEVILFHLAEKKHELDFDFENRPYQFVDLETGEKIKLHAHEVKEHYVKQMQDFKKELKLKCGQYKIDLIETDISKGIEEVLLPYFLKRVQKH